MWSFRFLRISLCSTSRIWPCICEEMDWNLLEKCGPWMWSLEVWRIFTYSFFTNFTSHCKKTGLRLRGWGSLVLCWHMSDSTDENQNTQVSPTRFRLDTSQIQVGSFSASISLLSQRTSDRMHRLHMYLLKELTVDTAWICTCNSTAYRWQCIEKIMQDSGYKNIRLYI